MALVSETHAPSCSIAGARFVTNFATYSGERVLPYAFSSTWSMPAHLSTQRVQAELAETGRAWKVTDMASGGSGRARAGVTFRRSRSVSSGIIGNDAF